MYRETFIILLLWNLYLLCDHVYLFQYLGPHWIDGEPPHLPRPTENLEYFLKGPTILKMYIFTYVDKVQILLN